MERNEIKAIIENILLAADQPVTADQLFTTLHNDVDKNGLKEILRELTEDYSARNLQIIEVASGYQLATRHEYYEWIKKYLKLDRTFKLSQPALDTLSIIAYKQPITKTEVEQIRGVDSSGVVRTLLEKNIVAPAGRKKVLGRPMMYRTSRKFLEYFGLKDLSELPTLEDLGEGELLGESDPAEQTQLPFEDGTGPSASESSDSLDEENTIVEETDTSSSESVEDDQETS